MMVEKANRRPFYQNEFRHSQKASPQKRAQRRRAAHKNRGAHSFKLHTGLPAHPHIAFIEVMRVFITRCILLLLGVLIVEKAKDFDALIVPCLAPHYCTPIVSIIKL
jgi:hypothetical protein